MYAIIESGGKQFKVSEGSILKVEKLEAEIGTDVVFDRILAIRDENANEMEIGAPFLKGAKVTAKVLSHGKGKKIIVFKFKPKKNYRKKQGHRQPFTQLIIQKIDQS
jgi:large subunit ribosomal protein L21